MADQSALSQPLQPSKDMPDYLHTTSYIYQFPTKLLSLLPQWMYLVIGIVDVIDYWCIFVIAERQKMVNIMWCIQSNSNVDLDPLPANHRPLFPWRHRANVNKPKFECWWAPWVRFSTFFTWFPPPTCPRRHERQEIYLGAVQSHEIGEWAAEK